jgi:type IV secretory pathway VirB10-like protein
MDPQMTDTSVRPVNQRQRTLVTLLTGVLTVAGVGFAYAAGSGGTPPTAPSIIQAQRAAYTVVPQTPVPVASVEKLPDPDKADQASSGDSDTPKTVQKKSSPAPRRPTVKRADDDDDRETVKPRIRDEDDDDHDDGEESDHDEDEDERDD